MWILLQGTVYQNKWAHITSIVWKANESHLIFSVSCSVFSRMARDSWDTGFSITLFSVTWQEKEIYSSNTVQTPEVKLKRSSATSSALMLCRLLTTCSDSSAGATAGHAFCKFRLASGIWCRNWKSTKQQRTWYYSAAQLCSTLIIIRFSSSKSSH